MSKRCFVPVGGSTTVPAVTAQPAPAPAPGQPVAAGTAPIVGPAAQAALEAVTAAAGAPARPAVWPQAAAAVPPEIGAGAPAVAMPERAAAPAAAASPAAARGGSQRAAALEGGGTAAAQPAARPPESWSRDEAMDRTGHFGRLGDGGQWRPTQLGGSDVVRPLRRYTQDTTPAAVKPSCTKHQVSHRTLLPGCMVFWCMKCRVCRHFNVMHRAESPRHVFEVLLTRCPLAPLRFCFDNGCNVYAYFLNREPEFFKRTRMFVDESHFRGHKNCAPDYNTGNSCFQFHYGMIPIALPPSSLLLAKVVTRVCVRHFPIKLTLALASACREVGGHQELAPGRAEELLLAHAGDVGFLHEANDVHAVHALCPVSAQQAGAANRSQRLLLAVVPAVALTIQFAAVSILLS